MFLFNFYIDDSNNLRNILVGEITKENEAKYGISMDTIGNDNVLEMLNKPDGPMTVYHDIRKVRNGDIASVYDNDRLLVSMKYEPNGQYLRRYTGREKLLFNKEKIKTVKFNKSGSITCNFGCEDKTYVNNEYVVHIVPKNNKSVDLLRIQKEFVFPYYTNIAIEELLRTMDIQMVYYNTYIRRFPDKKYQAVSCLLGSERKEVFDKLLNIILKAAERYTIFLNFERKN